MMILCHEGVFIRGLISYFRPDADDQFIQVR